MIGNVKTPLPSLANGFSRTPEAAACPHLRRLVGVGRKGLVATCNPCLGIQSTDIANLGRQKKGNYSVATVNWVQSPIGPALVINEGTDSILWASADNDDFQFQNAYGVYDISLSCMVRIHSSAEGAGHLFCSDRVTGNPIGIAIWVDEGTKSVRCRLADGSVALGSLGYYATANNAVTLDRWTHIIVVWSDDVTFGSPEVWVDGVRFFTTLNGTGKPLTHSGTSTTRIGRNAGSSKVDIADLALWNTGLQYGEIEPLINDPLCYLRNRTVRWRMGRVRLARAIRADDCVLKPA